MRLVRNIKKGYLTYNKRDKGETRFGISLMIATLVLVSPLIIYKTEDNLKEDDKIVRVKLISNSLVKEDRGTVNVRIESVSVEGVSVEGVRGIINSIKEVDKEFNNEINDSDSKISDSSANQVENKEEVSNPIIEEIPIGTPDKPIIEESSVSSNITVTTESTSDNTLLSSKQAPVEEPVSKISLDSNEPVDMNDSRLEYKLLEAPNPNYPLKARLFNINYEVEVTFKVDRKVISFDIPKDKYGFDKEIAKVLSKYKFSDILVNNKATVVTFKKKFIFKIGG